MFVKSTWQVLVWSANHIQPASSWLAEHFETIKWSPQTLNFLGKNIELCHDMRIDNVLSATVHP